jgi:hypothetical protein
MSNDAWGTVTLAIVVAMFLVSKWIDRRRP